MASLVVLLLPLFLVLFQVVDASLSAQQGYDRDHATLLKIREQFGNPPELGSWRSVTDHCVPGWTGVFCDEDGHRRVIYLVFQGRKFNATLPPAIGELDQLQLINIVGMTGFSGPIPATFGDLPRLSTLNIVGTSVSGAIPASLSRATSLTSVSLSGNRLTGRIPASLKDLPRLTFFKADNNFLTGPIPPLLLRGGAGGTPVSLFLSNNRLTGSIPWVYGVQSSFIEFRVAANRLTGDASFLFGRRKSVWDMDLSGNRLRFNLTGVEMPQNLQSLNLARNRIFGRVPAALPLASQLVGLDLSGNELCGEIPTGGEMGRFTAASYEGNKCLCGAPLPPC